MNFLESFVFERTCATAKAKRRRGKKQPNQLLIRGSRAAKRATDFFMYFIRVLIVDRFGCFSMFVPSIRIEYKTEYFFSLPSASRHAGS